MTRLQARELEVAGLGGLPHAADANMAHEKPGKTGDSEFLMKSNHIIAAALTAFAAAAFAQSAQAPAAVEASVDHDQGRSPQGRDKEAGKITIRHEALENLGMPAMTMVFRAADPKFLDAVRQGDEVQFVAEKVEGQFTVTRLQAAK